MSLTFKQFHSYVEAPIEAPLDEVFGVFASKEKKEQAELQKLELLAKRGNEAAKMKLRDIQLKKDKEAAAGDARKKADDAKFGQAKAYADADERGSSRAYDKEQGSLKKNMAPRWDARLKKWIKPGEDAWAHVGKHD